MHGSRVWIGALLIGALLVFTGAESPPVLATDPFSIAPLFQRVAVGAQEQQTRFITLRGQQDLTVLAIESDCRCVEVQTPLPAAVRAGADLNITLGVHGALPGVKTLRVRTTAGSLPVQVQVISGGLGDGLSRWQHVAREAQAQRQRLLVIMHDVRGAVRNCGCSGGSLGGIDHVAALPEALRTWAPGLDVRCVLTGDVDGHRPGIAAALKTYGWTSDDRVVVSGNPIAAVQDPATIAVVTTTRVALNHQKLVTPVLTEGMTAEVLILNEQDRIVQKETLPIDRTLPSRPEIVALFPDALTQQVDLAHTPSSDCMGCHAQAHAVWATSGHASAIHSLAPADRVDGCIGCHATPMTAQPPTLAASVHCQSCHLDVAGHVASPLVKTGGLLDCRTCHDARHDPSFDPVRAWQAIAHGR